MPSLSLTMANGLWDRVPLEPIPPLTHLCLHDTSISYDQSLCLIRKWSAWQSCSGDAARGCIPNLNMVNVNQVSSLMKNYKWGESTYCSPFTLTIYNGKQHYVCTKSWIHARETVGNQDKFSQSRDDKKHWKSCYISTDHLKWLYTLNLLCKSKCLLGIENFPFKINYLPAGKNAKIKHAVLQNVCSIVVRHTFLHHCLLKQSDIAHPLQVSTLRYVVFKVTITFALGLEMLQLRCFPLFSNICMNTGELKSWS